MNNEQILGQFTSELSRSSEHTRRDRGFYAEKFLRFAGEKPLSDWNKTLVNDFLQDLEAQGYAPGTIRKIYGIVKRVFDSAKAVHEAERVRLISKVNPADPQALTQLIQAISLPPPNWDLGKRAGPRVEAEQVVKPANTLDELQAMVAAVKNGGGAEAAYLSLASVYGLRREELCRVTREHLDFDKKTIYVLTAKDGERRKQLLCDEIVPYLAQYDFNDGYTPFKMSQLYWKICAKAGVDHKDGYGWHAPRRYLDTVLVEIFGELLAHIFLRWKISSSSVMTQRYFSRNPLEIDREVLAGHPIVALWGSG